MNWDQVAGNLKQVKGNVREKWGILTDDDVRHCWKTRDTPRQDTRGHSIAREKAEKEFKDWEASLK